MRELFCDESGNTGVDLLNAEQPLFALASACLDSDRAAEMVRPLLRQKQVEAKYTKLRGSREGQAALLQFFSLPDLTTATAKALVVDKRFYLIAQLVDKLIEPPVYENGLDLYDGDGHVGLANVWYYAGHTIFPNGGWEKLLHAFLRAIRERSSVAYSSFDQTLRTAFLAAPERNRDLATGLALAYGRMREFLTPFPLQTFDPAPDLFSMMIDKWMKEETGFFDVTHDQSKPLKRSEPFLRALMTPAAPRIIGYGARQTELPLRIRKLTFSNSVTHPQLQVADLIAGATIDCLLAWSGRKAATDFHESMRNTRLADLVVDGMLPSPENVRRNNEREPGQFSLVDGKARFLKEIGYFEQASWGDTG
ncbi:DUF3800 domain-containing protein [Paraburkholderia bannensis]|uniref:DUF3800 domain-containing protein n=1 Tax=Paraburkholderia bannensis TaxID=765414 RepID=UPI0012EB7863|nr:DUF3800 domain-containing protein [Paraburkholderia bannensis]